MNFTPVYEHLTNSLIVDNGLEYISETKKAIALAYLSDSKKKKNDTYGFLFTNVKSIYQKLKNNQTTISHGLKDLGMLNFIYSKKYNEESFIFAINSGYSVIFIIAEKIEMIEGLKFM
jgi:hypothetical protein